MAARLDWILYLNDACTWEAQGQAEKFFSEAVGSNIVLTNEEIASLSQLERYMREQLAAQHFKRPLDFTYLNQQLSQVRLQLIPSAVTATNIVLPTLRANKEGTESSFDEVLNTVLFQFAHFLGETIDGETPYAVSRCEAICKKKTVEDCKEFYVKFRSLEDSYRAEISNDLQNYEEEVERCSDFFLASSTAKFCSDSCRFNSFALRKQMQSPNYQAEKQRRYRERQKSKP